MDLKSRIVDCIRDQAIASGRLEQLQREANQAQMGLVRISGKLDLLSELFKEEEGIDLNEYIQQDEVFKKLLESASNKGASLVQGSEGPVGSPRTGTTLRSENRKVAMSPALAKDEPTAEVVRRKNAPTIVIDDEPPMPPDPEEIDDEDK